MALNLCQELEEIAPSCYKENVFFLKTVCTEAVLKKKLLEISQMDASNNYFEVFSSENRLCSIFPPVRIEVEDLCFLVGK